MTRRIFKSICLVTLTVLLASLVFIMGVLYEYFSNARHEQLRTQTMLAAQGASGEGMAYFEGLDTGSCRITWINAAGAVLYDSRSDAAIMENHLDREEIIAALETGYGEISRYSATLTERMLYSAQRLPDGSVIRLAQSQYTLLTLTLAILQPLLVILTLAIVLALILASRLAKKIVGPLNSFDLDKPLSYTAYPELSPMLERLDSQQRQLKRHEAELRRRREELETVTNSMNEGLLLLNEKGRVLSANSRATALLQLDGATGESVYTSGCPEQVLELIDAARGGLAAERLLEIGEGSYQLSASPIISDMAVAGIALIIFDVTERERSEQLRREFTANVSHELKTPLHSISGYAELLKNGMVKAGDIPSFSQRIYSEAQRMIRLVDDIIKLSRLDEGGEAMQWESVELYESAEAVIKSLGPLAQEAGVSMNLTGERCMIRAVPQLVSAIIFNLCDNAIKYNRRGGGVWVEILDGDREAGLRVRDSGIGIAPEHQERIFERFYRVDKSHSKEIGGTGLGLSIVKHGARLHGAGISLESVPGEGTTVTVCFPKNE